MTDHDTFATATATTADIDEERARRLRRLNVAAGTAHAVQAALMIALTNDTALPVTASFATGPPGQPAEAASIDELFSYPLGYAVALFSVLSAFFHFLVASP